MIRILAALTATVALGLLSRLYPVGWWPYDKSLGDALYAVAAYLTLALVFVRKPPAFVAAVALALCLAVECFKLTGVPARLAGPFPLAGWLLGTTFAWHNLACYAAGVALVTASDVLLLRPTRAARSHSQ
jgi:hypothetical protein